MNTRALAFTMAAILTFGAFNASTSGNLGLAIALALGAMTAIVGPLKVIAAVVALISGTLGLLAITVVGLIALLIVLAFAQAAPGAATFLIPTLGILAAIALAKGMKHRMGFGA